MGRNLENLKQRSDKEIFINQIRPKSEKFRAEVSIRKTQKSATNLIKKNLDDYIFNLSNWELKQKLDSCPGIIGECPLITEFREELRKSISNHVGLKSQNEIKLSNTSRNINSPKARDNFNIGNNKMISPQSNESSGKKGAKREIKSTSSSTSRSMIRSTRAQDLRSQSNRDLMKPKPAAKSTKFVSPYIPAAPLKKKKVLGTRNPDVKPITRSNTLKTTDEKKKMTKNAGESKHFSSLGKLKKDKPSTAGETVPLQRQKTQDIINPKIVKKDNRNMAGGKINAVPAAGGDCEPPQIKKSQTFFICKGAKNGGECEKPRLEREKTGNATKSDSVSDGNVTDDDILSPKHKPLTHNDSFCLIIKSSQNWAQKNRSDDEKLLQYDLTRKEKANRSSEKGILKSANYDLKSVDSLEKVDSEKIVRFSDEIMRNKKVLKKLVRRKKRLNNFFSPDWYQRNKLFQKYLQILREKSVLLSERVDLPEDQKPFRVPQHVKEIYEAEMFGLHLKKEKSVRSHKKDAYSY